MEQWKYAPECEGLCQVSDLGGVRSRRDRNGRPIVGWRLIKPSVHRQGYLQIELRIGGRRRFYLVHRLVVDAFLPPKRPTDTVVRHLNDDPTDNRVCNLARGTQKENMADAIRNDKLRPCRGSLHGNAKLTEDDVREIRRLYATGTFSKRALAQKFGVSDVMIGLIVRWQSWQHVI